jgi:glycosyltransferase involved in cell wall biosynthesis
MMKCAYVTIGICVRNCEKTIGGALKSVFGQDYPHEAMELIIVDDGSTDRTLEYVRQIVSDNDIYTKVFHQSWRGLGAARNLVVRNACGKYIIWVDGDMELTPDFVRKQVEFMERNPKVGAAKGRYKLIKSKNIVAILENSRAFHLLKEDSKIVGTGGSIYRIEAIKKIGGFDEGIRGAGEDLDALLRMQKEGWLLSRTDAEFYESFKDNWKDLWLEYYWWGYGAHYVRHKHKDKISLIVRLPPVSFIIAFARLFLIFRSTARLSYLLLPIHSVFKDSAWIFGFLRSHKNEYGHKKR